MISVHEQLTSSDRSSAPSPAESLNDDGDRPALRLSYAQQAVSPDTSASISVGIAFESSTEGAGGAVASGAYPPSRQSGGRVERTVSREARPYLNGEMESVVRNLEGVILSAANQSHVRLRAIDIGVKSSSSGYRRAPKVSITVRTAPETLPAQALALWDTIGLAVDRWTPRLRQRARQLLSDRIAVRVDWEE